MNLWLVCCLRYLCSWFGCVLSVVVSCGSWLLFVSICEGMVVIDIIGVDIVSGLLLWLKIVLCDIVIGILCRKCVLFCF